MGLPVWRDPTETKQHKARNTSDSVTAAARSSIRRRPELPGRSSTRSRYAPPPYPSRLERGTTLRDPRRYASRLHNASNAAIPPVRSLLETVDRLTPSQSSVVAPPPVPALPIERLDSLPHTLSFYDAELDLFSTDEEEDADMVDLRPQSRDGQSYRPRRSGAAGTTDHPDTWASSTAMATNTLRPDHPLRHSWRPSSPSIQGLGDRTRSPTPGEGWELMRATIAPDEVLPSAESSFASAAASRSFGSSSVSRASGSLSSRTSVYSRPPLDDHMQGGESAEELVYCAVAASPIMRALTEDMYLYACESSEGRMRLNEVHRRLSHLGMTNASPSVMGSSLMECLSDAGLEEYLRPTTRISASLRRYLRCRRAVGADLSLAREASDATTANPPAYERGSSTDIFVRAWNLYSSHFEPPAPRLDDIILSDITDDPTEASLAELSFPTGITTDIRAAHDIFLRLAARGDVGDDVWETVGLLMSTSATRFAEPPILTQAQREMRLRIARNRAAEASATATSAVAVADRATNTESPTSPPPEDGAESTARHNEDDGEEDYRSRLRALERQNRERLAEARRLADDVALVSNDFSTAGARRGDASS